jgi:alpha-beta hydrolase superfamily lysophospholipase
LDRRQQGQARGRSAHELDLDLPVPLGGGRADNETALEWAKKFTLEGVAQRIECAFLVLHGENNRIVPLAEAKKLYERVGSKRENIKIFHR